MNKTDELVECIKWLPNAENIDEEQIREYARELEAAKREGWELERARYKNTTHKKTMKDLTRLISLSGKLDEHIRSIRKPAFTALLNRNFNPDELTKHLMELQETASWALDDFDDYPIEGDGKGGVPKVVNEQVTIYARYVFYKVTGQKAGYNLDSTTHRRFGEFPTFLCDVFDTLKIGGSIDFQLIRKG